MAYKKYIHLIIRLLLILINMALLSLILFNPDRLFSILILLIILGIQITELIRFETRSFRTLDNILSSFEFEYKPAHLNKKLPKQIEGFYKSLNRILDFIEKKKSENEAQLLFMAELLKHIKTGIISCTEDENIKLSNQEAMDILGFENLINLGQIKNKHPEFYDAISRPIANRAQTIEISKGERTQTLTIQLSIIKVQEHRMKLISFQDIRAQIEYKQMEAWHQLIRTLGHEILNSVTPISSMTETSIMLLEKPDQTPRALSELTDQNLIKIRSALKTINRRSIGLLEFINNYRKLTRMPVPKLEPTNLNKLVKDVFKLLEAELKREGIDPCLEQTNPEILLNIDKSMIEQVLINLIQNAIQASAGLDRKKITVKLEQNGQDVIIHIKDNGNGINDEIRDKIFIPFFTTKDKGSGIGLSLSRQIMQLHGGSINYKRNDKNETVFSLIFK